MAEFVFWYDETITYKAGFEADSREDALRQLEETFAYRPISDPRFLEDLKEFWNKEKDFSKDFDPDTLEEIKETE